MKFILFSLAVLTGAVVTSAAFSVEPACASGDKYSQCYYECKPAEDGDGGNDFSACMAACLAN